MDLHKDPDYDKFETTFSNSPCFSNYCLRQSYPQPYPFENNPTTGHISTNLDKNVKIIFLVVQLHYIK